MSMGVGKGSGVNRAEKNRAVRREALREQLQAQGHHQHIIEIINKLIDLDNPLDSTQVAWLSKVLDTKLRLIAKYLPDDKEPSNVNLGGQEDNPVETRFTWAQSEK